MEFYQAHQLAQQILKHDKIDFLRFYIRLSIILIDEDTTPYGAFNQVKALDFAYIILSSHDYIFCQAPVVNS